MCSGTSTNITGLGGVFVPGKISSIEWPLISGSMEMAVIVVDLIVVTSSVSSGTGTPLHTVTTKQSSTSRMDILENAEDVISGTAFITVCP